MLPGGGIRVEEDGHLLPIVPALVRVISKP